VLLGIVARFADGLGDLCGLALARADHAFAVTNDDYGAEVESAATLYHFGYAVDLDQFLFQL
jgi:hypothetical protein